MTAPFFLAAVLISAAVTYVGSSSAEDLSGAPTENAFCQDRAIPLSAGTDRSDGEPSIRTDPVDPRRALATWTGDSSRSPFIDSPVEGSVILARRSEDGSWTKEKVVRQVGEFGYGDPWLDTSPDGDAYLSYIGAEYTGTESAGVFLHRIEPGGPTGPDLDPPFDGDRPVISVDQRLFPTGDRLYLAANSRLIESRDSGQSWSETRVISPEANLTTVATGGDRVLTVYTTDPEDGIFNVHVAEYIEEGRFEESASFEVVDLGFPFWGPLGTGTVPTLTVVRQGPLTGAGYLAWAQKGEGNDHADIYVTASFDGKHWSEPRDVSDDQVGAFQVLPSLSATNMGDAVLAWMDSRRAPQGPMDPDSAHMFGSHIRVAGTPQKPEIRIGKNLQLTGCRTFDESEGNTLGDYFNIDASQGQLDMVFPQIRSPGAPSDVFFVGW